MSLLESFVLNPEDPAYVADPSTTVDFLLGHAPIYQWTERGAVLFSRMADSRAMLTDARVTTDMRSWEAFGVVFKGGFEGERFRAFTRLFFNALFNMPNDQHARVRKLAAAAFTPRMVRGMHATIQAIVDRELDKLAASGQPIVNLRDFAEAVPITVIADILGVPTEYRDDLRRLGQATIKAASPTLPPEAWLEIADDYTKGEALIERLIADRRAAPNRAGAEDDLISVLLAANEAGQTLTNDELVAIIFTVVGAGADTSVHAMCLAAYELLTHPDALHEVQADRSLLRNAIEEAQRVNGIGKTGLTRFTTEAFELAGTPLRKGQMVIAFNVAAHRDTEVFANPDTYDIHRDTSETLTYGFGVHYCLGAALARAELEISLATLLIDRFPEATLAGELRFEAHPLLRSVVALPIRLYPESH